MKLREKLNQKSKSKSVHEGGCPSGECFESELGSCIINQINHDLTVSTLNIVAKNGSFDPLFLLLSKTKQFSYVYRFPDRNKMTLRRVTREGQKLSGHLEQTRCDFVLPVNERFQKNGELHGIPRSMIVNMDQTCSYFENKSKVTVNFKGEKTIAQRCSGSNQYRLTECVAYTLSGRCRWY